MNKIIIILFMFISLSSLAANFRQRANQFGGNYSEDDIKEEIKFGRNLAAKILAKYPLIDNKSAQDYVNVVGSALAAQIGRPELKYYFGVIEANDINAYACPGGYIFLTKGLLASLQNEAQLAGVLAHEIGHVNYRHVVKKLKIRGDGGLVSAAGSLIGGATASYRNLLSALLDKGFEILFETGLPQRDEAQSDHVSFEALVGLNYNVQSYYQYLFFLGKKLQQGQAQVLSKTHPPMDNRVNLLKKKEKSFNYDPSSGVLNRERFVKYVQL